jgi:membrane protease YdiL (CAAX protease family)
VLVEGGLVLLAMLLAWLFRVSLAEQLPADGAAFVAALGRGLLGALVMLILFFGLYHAPQNEFRRLRGQVEWLVNELFPAGNVGQFALVSALAGVGEELLFRGVIQTAIAGWTTPVAGLAITSLLFGLAHSLSRLYFLLATMIGFFLGWIAMQTNDLLGPIVAHGAYDFVALIYLARKRESR